MVGETGVSIILLIVWSLAFLINRKKIYSAKIYFYILFIMSSAGVILDLNFYYYTKTYNAFVILLFAFIMLLVLIPWKQFDNWMKRNIIVINEKYIGLIKGTIILCSFLSIFTIIYCLPYALMAHTLGALDVRQEEGLFPASPLTTLAAAVAGLTPFGILGFFICRLDTRLYLYSFLSLLLVISGVVHSMAWMARELYVFLPITFVILYFLFKNSMSLKTIKYIKYLSIGIGFLLVIFFLEISTSRFGEAGSDEFISGTWGYIYQQPYVFDQTFRHFDNFYAFDRRLQFLGPIFGVGDGEFDYNNSAEYSFGTMYNEFYQMFGLSSLIIATFLYIFYFYKVSRICISRKLTFSIVVNFTLFIWFTVSGLFYFRYGITSYFLLYLFISLISLRCPSVLLYKKNNYNLTKL